MVPKFVGRGRLEVEVDVLPVPDEYDVVRGLGVYEAATVVGGLTVAVRGGLVTHGCTMKNE